jgi:hypothetical protein
MKKPGAIDFVAFMFILLKFPRAFGPSPMFTTHGCAKTCGGKSRGTRFFRDTVVILSGPFLKDRARYRMPYHKLEEPLARALIPLAALLLLSTPCQAASTPSSVISTTSVPAATTNTTTNLNQPSSAIDALRNLGRAQSPEDTAAAKSNFTDPAAIEAAANRGDAIAQFNLGHQYENGSGKDFVEAAKWYRKSAQQGYARAQYNLGYFYDQGYGVPQDYEQAYFWWTLAAAAGDAAYAHKRDSVELFLNSGQIQGVREKVAAWKPASARDTADPSALKPHKHRDCKEAGQGACDDQELHDNRP